MAQAISPQVVMYNSTFVPFDTSFQSQLLTGANNQAASLSSLANSNFGTASVLGSQLNLNTLNQLGNASIPLASGSSVLTFSQSVGGAAPTALNQSAINLLQAGASGANFGNAIAGLTGDQLATNGVNLANIAAPAASMITFGQSLNTSLPSSLTSTNTLNASALNGTAMVSGNGHSQISGVNLNALNFVSGVGTTFALSQNGPTGAMNVVSGNTIQATAVSGSAIIR